MKKTLFILLCLFTLTSAFSQRVINNGKPFNSGNNNQSNNFERAEGAYYTVNGMNMYYESYGDGDPLLIIHDRGGDISDLLIQVKFFSKKFRVIVADTRGHGNSVNKKDSYDFEFLADDYNLLLEGLSIDSAYVLGWGDGGAIGLLLAIHYPEKVKMLTIVGTALQADTIGYRPEIIAQLNDEINNLSDSVAAGKKQYNNLLLADKMHMNNLNIDEASLLNINVPVLVMSGDKDIVNLTHTLNIYASLPHAQLAIFPGTTHLVLKQSAMQCNNMILRFYTKPFLRPDGINELKPTGAGDKESDD